MNERRGADGLLPVCERARIPSTEESMQDRARILIGEDDSALGECLADLLRACRHQVDLVDNGLAVLEHAELCAPDLLVLDLGLPGLDGIGVLEVLRASLPLRSVPVLVATADSRRSIVRRAIALGASDYVAKPYAVADVIERVARLLARRRGVLHTRWQDDWVPVDRPTRIH